MSEPKLFTEEEVIEIVKREVMKNLRVTGWAGLESNGCGYSHVTGGASASWNGERIGDKPREIRRDDSPVKTH